MSELLREPDVAGEHLAQVADGMALLAMRSIPKPKAKPLHFSGRSRRRAGRWGGPCRSRRAPATRRSACGCRTPGRLGEREVARPQAGVKPGLEEGLGEGLDRAREVRQGDARGRRPSPRSGGRRACAWRRGCPAGTPARGRRCRSAGRRRASPGSAPARCACGARCGRVRRRVVDEQGVEVTAGRMADAHVEGLEVVPVGLHLGTLGDLEAEPDEHVLQPFPGLGDEMRAAATRLGGELGEVEPLGLDRRCNSVVPRSSRWVARAAAAAAVASLSCCPACLRSSTVPSEPSRVFSGPDHRACRAVGCRAWRRRRARWRRRSARAPPRGRHGCRRSTGVLSA